MRTLVIDTATEACSVALFADDELIDGNYIKLGRGHAERLVPMISALQDNGKADHILVNSGPGSFTGLRVGISAAKALGLAWKVPVYGYQSLSLVAAIMLHEMGGTPSISGVDVAMLGGHGEYFVQSYDTKGSAVSEMTSLKPAAALKILKFDTIGGSAAKALVDLRGHGTAFSIWPDARHALLLGKLQRSLPPEPVYGRRPDAKPMPSASIPAEAP